MSNISAVSLNLLNQQIAHELWNSSIYRYMGSYLKKMGLNNIGNFFYEDQVKEEQSHAQLISDYINDRNETVQALSVPEGNVDIQNLNHFASLYLEREQLTTAKLSAIAQQALTESDYMLFDFMQEMIRKQRSEEDEALTFMDRAFMAANDLKTWLIFDATYCK
jgi:ferritin